MPSELYDQIISTYKKTESVQQTAVILKTDKIKVRRVLLTEGLWSSGRSVEVDRLLKKGLSTNQIAERLNITEKAVQAYLPYSRGEYNLEDKSYDAHKADDYRERMQIAADKQIHIASKLNSEEINEMKKSFTCQRILKLHLELNLDYADMDVLKRYGKVRDGITRDILVPDRMTLNGLNYAIQKCFGWQNSHLHNFTLPDDAFLKITNDNLETWKKYCGLYFRFPIEDYGDDEILSELYWNDDYEEGRSFNSWLKKKYTYAFGYGGNVEYFYKAQNLMRDFLGDTKVKKKISNCDKFWIMSIYELLERLPIGQVISVKDKLASDDDLNNIISKLDYEHLQEAGERYEELKSRRHFTSKEKEPIKYCLTPEVLPVSDTLLYSYDYGDGWKVKVTCVEEYLSKENVELTKEGYYLVCLDKNELFKRQLTYDGEGREITGELRNQIATVAADSKPVCIALDGYPVMDDVMGISGYCEFLKGIHGEEQDAPYEDIEESKEWAKMQGWTGRLPKPEKLL